MPKKSQDPVVVGWREMVSLPEWGIKRLKAKIDTGARTSAIHVGDLEELPNGRVRFEVVVREKPNRRTTFVEATPVRHSIVKPSHGVKQQRYVFRTRLVLGTIERDIELSLTSRKGMLCRMLVGRQALPSHVMVQPSRRYLLSKPPGSKTKTGDKS
jgi:hypothetical protein